MMDKKIFLVLFASLVARLILFFFDANIWWDAAVYLSMGKYLFFHVGLWEPIRPLLWPFILGYGSYIGINEIIWGHIFTTFFSLGCIYLTYIIAKRLFDEKVALLSSILLSFTWVFFVFNIRLYSEIPALFFALLAYYCFLKDKPLLSGFFVGLSCLSKFPEGILLVVLGIFYLKHFKKLFYFVYGFLVIAIPYLSFNYFLYGSPIGNILFAQEIVKSAGIWIFQQPFYFYFVELIKQNVLFLLAIPGMIFAVKKRYYALVLLLIAPFLYFTLIEHKELRFAILFIPFLCILASYGYSKTLSNIESFIIIVLLVFMINIQIDPTINNDFNRFFENKSVNGEILVTDPLTAYYINSEVTMMYYPWFNSSMADYWYEYIEKNNPVYISIDTCDGGLICPPSDVQCEPKLLKLLNFLDLNYNKEYYRETNKCKSIIYSKLAFNNSLTSS